MICYSYSLQKKAYSTLNRALNPQTGQLQAYRSDAEPEVDPSRDLSPDTSRTVISTCVTECDHFPLFYVFSDFIS